MSGSLEVDFDGVDALTRGLDAAHAELAATLDELERRLLVLESAWSGEARDAFRTARLQWAAQMAALAEVLDDARGALARSGEGYRDAERSALARWLR